MNVHFCKDDVSLIWWLSLKEYKSTVITMRICSATCQHLRDNPGPSTFAFPQRVDTPILLHGDILASNNCTQGTPMISQGLQFGLIRLDNSLDRIIRYATVRRRTVSPSKSRAVDRWKFVRHLLWRPSLIKTWTMSSPPPVIDFLRLG